MKTITRFVLVTVLMSLCSILYADPPTESGVVFRGEYPVATFWVDEDSGLMVFFDDVVGFCSDPSFEFEVLTWMDVYANSAPPPDGPRIVTRFHGQILASVWPIFDFDCERFTTDLPIASGMVTLSLNDNDLFARLNPGNNVNVVNRRAQGFLYTPDGERKRLSFKQYLMWDGEDIGTLVERIKVELN